MNHLCILLAVSLMAFSLGCSKQVDNTGPQTPGVPEIPGVNLWPGMTSIDVRPVFPKELSTVKPIHAVMDVESLVDGILTIQYRIQWLDSQGRILNPDANFKILNMAPGTQRRLDVTDPQGNAVSWRADFRPVM